MMEKEKEVEEKIDLKSFWPRIWKLLAPSHKAIWNLLFLIMIGEFFLLIPPFIFKLIVDKITVFQLVVLKEVLLMAGGMFLIYQGLSLLDYFIDKKVFNTIIDFIVYLNQDAHKKMVFLGLGYHEKENTGSKVIKINRGIDRIDNLFSTFFWEVFPTIFQIIATVVILYFISWFFLVTFLIFVPLFVWLTFHVNGLVAGHRKKRFDFQEEAASLMTQSIININTVKSFVQEWREYRRFSHAMKGVSENSRKEVGKIFQYNLLRTLVIDLGRLFVLLSGVYLLFKGQITVGSLVFIYTISEKGLLSLFRISRLYDRIMESAEAVNRLYFLSQEKEQIENPAKGLKPKEIKGKIEFKNVSFAYQENNRRALDKASFVINSECVTALVGPSGGGKTTVARMIYRHYDPTGGEILLDDKNLKEYDLYAFRKFIAIVPQEVEIFDQTISENIAYARPSASFQEIQAAARIANAEEFINQMEKGYETLVGERGIRLSGGQRQRVGIARAILANPRVLIFDEATSSLDSYSEKLIQEAMDKISQHRTVIIIAHRLSTIRKADKIIVLEKGKVAEEGCHLELAHSKGGLYQKLISLQKLGEVE